VVKATPWPLYPREGPVNHCMGGWVDSRAGLDRCGKSRPHRDSIPGPSSPWRIEKRFGELANTKCGRLQNSTLLMRLLYLYVVPLPSNFRRKPHTAPHLTALQTPKLPLQSYCNTDSSCSLPRTRHVSVAVLLFHSASDVFWLFTFCHVA
jgi:hypothetical protein